MDLKKIMFVAMLGSLLFLLIPLGSIIKTVNLKKNGVKAEATVTYRSISSKGLPKLTVAFDADGKQVTATSSKRKYAGKGEKVEIWYDRSEPQNITFGDTVAYNLRGVVLILFFFLFFLYFFIRYSREGKLEKLLKSSGLKIPAEFVSVERNDKYRMGEKNPWRIKCRWRDPDSDEEIIFFSSDYTVDPAQYMKGRQYFDVYIDRKDHRKYYFDDSFLPDRNIKM